MDETEKEVVRRFLRDFKQIATAGRGVDIVDRRKNMQSLAQLGLTKRNCIAIILELSLLRTTAMGQNRIRDDQEKFGNSVRS